LPCLDDADRCLAYAKSNKPTSQSCLRMHASVYNGIVQRSNAFQSAFDGMTPQAVIDSTVEAVAMLQDEQGRVKFEDLQQAKLDRCEEENVQITWAGRIEVVLVISWWTRPWLRGSLRRGTIPERQSPVDHWGA